MRPSSRRAFTIRETLVVACCVIVITVLLYFLRSGHGHNHKNYARTKDATQLRGIHQSWLVFSREFSGLLPTPGLVDRLPFNGVETPGRGEEDITKNTTANLFSLCIMSNLFTADMCIGNTEPSPRIRDFEESQKYDYTLYNPVISRYWDTNFKADLHVLSHVSYAHMPIAGEMKSKHWRDTMDATMPILGNRGPLGGVHDPKSITNKIHPPYDRWSGNIIFSDNHIVIARDGFPTRPRVSGQGYLIAPECLPADKLPPPTDAVITFTKTMTENGPIIQHD